MIMLIIKGKFSNYNFSLKIPIHLDILAILIRNYLILSFINFFLFLFLSRIHVYMHNGGKYEYNSTLIRFLRNIEDEMKQISIGGRCNFLLKVERDEVYHEDKKRKGWRYWERMYVYMYVYVSEVVFERISTSTVASSTFFHIESNLSPSG